MRDLLVPFGVALSALFMGGALAPAPEENEPKAPRFVTLRTGNIKFCGKDLNNLPRPKHTLPSERVLIRRERRRAARRLAAKCRARS